MLPSFSLRGKLGVFKLAHENWEDALFKTTALVIGLSLITFSSTAADAARGQTLYKTCIQCHGEDGRGNPDQEAPRIAGQYDWYIISSIEQFKAGVERKNPKMLPYIKNLSSTDIEDLAAYISKMK
ncbi:MAG: c-type cytochrome [Peredibacter sp.]